MPKNTAFQGITGGLTRTARKRLLILMRAARRRKSSGKARTVSPIAMLYGYVAVCIVAVAVASVPGLMDNLSVQTVSDATDGWKTSNIDDEAQPKPDARPALTCGEDALGTGRKIVVDAQGGPQFGLVQFKNTLPLENKEVVFTFDDGPHYQRTYTILDTLDKYCVKAVFFIIGQEAQRFPGIVREIERRGHVIGTHTMSHPVSLTFVAPGRAVNEIEQGFAAVAQALGHPPSPYFRFPGLGQNKQLLDYVASRNIAVWSVDAVSGDSEGASAARLPGRLMSRLEKHGRGILLFHDIKASTVEALPVIMDQLREEGYRAVEVVPSAPVELIPDVVSDLPQGRTKRRSYSRHERGYIR